MNHTSIAAALFIIVLSGTLVAGCREARSVASQEEADLQREFERAPLDGSDAAASAIAGSPQDPLALLVDSLAKIPGEFESNPVGTFSFRGDETLFNAFYQYADSAVVALVECLGNSSPARATYEGRPVPIGYMCYSALIRMAYPTAFEDSPGDWPGVLLNPAPSADELRAAQRAWEEVIAQDAYRIAFDQAFQDVSRVALGVGGRWS